MACNGFDRKTGVLLGKRREAKGWSQEQLREKIGIEHRETITQWENGTRKIKAEHLAQICKALDVSADYLLGLSDDPRRTPSAVDELCLSPEAIKQITDLRDLRTLDSDENGWHHRVFETLDWLLRSGNLYAFVLLIDKAKEAAQKQLAAYAEAISSGSTAKIDAAYIRYQTQYNDNYDYENYLAAKQFSELLDSFCHRDQIDTLKSKMLDILEEKEAADHGNDSQD